MIEFTPHFILLNGPPRSGKDTAANYLAQQYSRVHMKFAGTMFETLHTLFGIPLLTWVDMYENRKNEPSEVLFGMSPRQAMIWLSEEVMKPRFGPHVFGEIFTRRVMGSLLTKNYHRHFVVSDSGFVSEAEVLIEHVGVDNVTLVQLHRTGCNFSGDSRSYIELECDTLAIDNSGAQEQLFTKLDEIIQLVGRETSYGNVP